MRTDIKIEYLDTKSIVPYENNPRVNDGAVDKVAASIRSFGFKVPIVVDSHNVVVTGHTRLKAALSLGMRTVPVIRADDLTDDEVRAFRIADNKVTEFSSWDLDLLRKEAQLLQETDLTSYGFTFDELMEQAFPNGEPEELPEPDFVTMSFNLHQEQKELIDLCLTAVKGMPVETYGNKNKNGNGIFAVVSQWVESKR